MAEAMAVIGLVQNVITIGELCLRLIRQVRTYQDLPDSLQDIQAKLPLILDSLRKIEHRIEEQDCSNETKKVWEPMLKRCQDLVQKLYDFLPKYETSKDYHLGRRVLKAISALSNESGIKDIADSIHQYIQTFSFAQTTDLWGSTSKAGREPAQEWLIQIPHKREHDFVGREQAMSQLKEAIDGQRDSALSGLGGVGYKAPNYLNPNSMLMLRRKSQIAIEQCWQVHEEKPGQHIFWVKASSRQSLVSGYREIAEGLHLASSNDEDSSVLQRVHRWLQDEANLPWLFVLDNADDLQTFYPPPNAAPEEEGFASEYLPLDLRGSAIVITRDARVATRMVSAQNHIQVPPLPADEAQELLRRRIGMTDNIPDDASLQLVHELDCLPIAIKQAAVFISENYTTVAEYLANFLTNACERQDLLSRGFGNLKRSADLKDSLMWTWKLSYDVLCEKYPRAAKVAAILGVMSCDSVPIKVLRKNSGESWAGFVDAVGTLQSFSFLERLNDNRSIQIHRLFHLCIQKWLEIEGKTDYWRQEALALLAEHHPGPEGDYKLGKDLDPHVRLMLHATSDFHGEMQYIDLLRKAGNFDRTQGNYDLADERLQKAREILESEWGSEHVLTLATYNELGMVACELYEFDEAEEYHSKAEAGFRKLHGPDHPDYLNVLINIGNLKKVKGHPDKAEAHFCQALAIYEKTHGPDHHLTLRCGCNVAFSLYDQSKFADAEVLLRRIFVRQEPLLGNEHPHTLETSQALALTLVQLQSQYEEAEMRQRKVLEVYLRTHGKHHIATWDSLDHLGIILHLRGKHDEALTLYLDMLDDVHKIIGADHPTTPQIQDHIALVYYEQGDFVNAEKHFQQALDVYYSSNSELVETLRATNNVAASLRGQGRLQEAEEMQRNVLERWEKGFSTDDDKTMDCLLSLAETVARQARFEEAIKMNRKAHETLLRTRGPNDAMVTRCDREHKELLERQEGMTDGTDNKLGDMEELSLTKVPGSITD